jgi:hypothetical protein
MLSAHRDLFKKRGARLSGGGSVLHTGSVTVQPTQSPLVLAPTLAIGCKPKAAALFVVCFFYAHSR